MDCEPRTSWGPVQVLLYIHFYNTLAGFQKLMAFLSD